MEPNFISPKQSSKKTQKFINLNQRYKKLKKQNTPKKEKKFEREREGNNLFCVGKICIECKREQKIYIQGMRIKRVKIKGREKNGGNVIVMYKINKRRRVKK